MCKIEGMRLTIELPKEKHSQIKSEAAKRGLTMKQFALQKLLPPYSDKKPVDMATMAAQIADEYPTALGKLAQ
jgi:hypothetical protein